MFLTPLRVPHDLSNCPRDKVARPTCDGAVEHHEASLADGAGVGHLGLHSAKREHREQSHYSVYQENRRAVINACRIDDRVASDRDSAEEPERQHRHKA